MAALTAEAPGLLHTERLHGTKRGWTNAGIERFDQLMIKVAQDYGRRHGAEPPPTCQEMRCHLGFDVKMEDVQWKARLVAGGLMTTGVTSPTITYASVV